MFLENSLAAEEFFAGRPEYSIIFGDINIYKVGFPVDLSSNPWNEIDLKITTMTLMTDMQYLLDSFLAINCISKKGCV